MDEFICAFSHLRRGMESHDLFRSGMIREKLCNFSSGLCFEKHSHFLFLQQRMSRSNSLTDSFLTIHQEHIIEVATLQKRMGGNDGRDAPFLLSLSSHSEEAGEEGNLPQDVSFFHATSLPLR